MGDVSVVGRDSSGVSSQIGCCDCVVSLQVTGEFCRGFCYTVCCDADNPSKPESYTCTCPVFTSIARLAASLSHFLETSSNPTGLGMDRQTQCISDRCCVHTVTAAWLAKHQPQPLHMAATHKGTIGVADRCIQRLLTTGAGVGWSCGTSQGSGEGAGDALGHVAGVATGSGGAGVVLVGPGAGMSDAGDYACQSRVSLQCSEVADKCCPGRCCLELEGILIQAVVWIKVAVKWTDGRDPDMTGVTTDHMYAAMNFSTTSVFHFSDLKTKPANSLLV
jgi:hypothetical protein